MEMYRTGALNPEVALSEAAKLLVQHLVLVAGVEAVALPEQQIEDERIPAHIYDVPIEDLELSVRAYNCLNTRAGIVRVGEVIERLERGPEELLSIRNSARNRLTS